LLPLVGRAAWVQRALAAWNGAVVSARSLAIFGNGVAVGAQAFDVQQTQVARRVDDGGDEVAARHIYGNVPLVMFMSLAVIIMSYRNLHACFQSGYSDQTCAGHRNDAHVLPLLF
jgi:hypothetical protein